MLGELDCCVFTNGTAESRGVQSGSFSGAHVPICLSVAVTIARVTTWHSFAELSGVGPFINGLRERYELNEQLDVNCTSPSVSPSNINGYQPRLGWQLNDESVSTGDYRNKINHT